VESSLSELIGSLATDVVKVGIATGASIAAATAVAAAGEVAAAGILVAIGPLVAAIIVGLLVSAALSWLDKQLQITERIIAALDEISEKGISGIVAEKKAEIVKTGEQIANKAAESVIDYAVEKVERIVVNLVRNFFNNIKIPQI